MSKERLIIGNYVILITNQTSDYELIIILECIVFQFHRSPAMKLIDLRVRQIKCVGCAGRVPACSRAIARASLKGLALSQHHSVEFSVSLYIISVISGSVLANHVTAAY